MSGAASVEDLRARIDLVLPTLAAFDADGFSAALGDVRGERFLVTGIGASRAAARLLASSLVDLGVDARFLPLSAFACDTVQPRAGESLCVFSQRLSPNARLALGQVGRFPASYLFTSMSTDAGDLQSFVRAGGHVLTLPPRDESASLLRIVGPSVAMFAATLFAHAAARRPAPCSHEALRALLAAARRRTSDAARALPDGACDAPLAFVVGADSHALADSLGIKWLEGLGGPEPPTWDVLEIAHGPFQSFYAEPRLLVAVGPSSPLFERLRSMLEPERHAWLHLTTSTPAAFRRLEVEVCANELLLSCFERRPRDLFAWPSQGKDTALYGIDRPAT